MGTIGQVLAGQTNGGVITSTTYHGGLKVPGFAGLYAGVPQVAATIPKTVVAAHTPAVHAVHAYGLPYAGYAGYAGHAGYGGVYYGKREAEAEPWTVAQVAHGAHLAYAAAPYAYAGYPYAHAGVYYGKREAEADPAVLAVSPYTALHHGIAAPYAYAGYPYAHAGVSTGLIGGVAGSNPVHAVAATPFGLTHSSNVGICTNYVGAQVPCGGRKKREADAQFLHHAGLYSGVYSGVYPTAYAGVHGTNPVHAVAHTAAGLTHSSNVGICTNYLGAVVPC